MKLDKMEDIVDQDTMNCSKRKKAKGKSRTKAVERKEDSGRYEDQQRRNFI